MKRQIIRRWLSEISWRISAGWYLFWFFSAITVPWIIVIGLTIALIMR